MDLGYEIPGTNVFLATNADVLFLNMTLQPGKWYYAEYSWKDFHGPYDTKVEADKHFQVYVKDQISCAGCGE